MKFVGIFRFELRYQARQFSTWLIGGFLLLFGFILPRIGTPTDDVYLNSNSFIAFIAVFGGVLWLLMGGGVAGDGATRDVSTRMHSLSYTTPTTKMQYLGGRFFAAFLINVLTLFIMFAGILLSFYTPGARTEMLGPFIPAAYLTIYGFLSLPNVFTITALQFTFAQHTGKAISSYLVSVAIFVTSHILSTSIDKYFSTDGWEKMFDLLGIVKIASDLETWTPYERNHRLIGLNGMFLASRLFWLAVGCIALAITYSRFQFAHIVEKRSVLKSINFRRRRDAIRPDVADEVVRKNIITGERIKIPDFPRKFNIISQLRQTAAIALASFRLIAFSRGGVLFIAILTTGAALLSTEWMEFLGVPLFPRTMEVLRFFTPALHDLKTLWIIIPLLTIVYAGELVWREREVNVSELVNTSPLSEGVLFCGKFLGLCLMILTWMGIFVLGSLLIQIVLNYRNYEMAVLVKALFGIQSVNYILFALPVMVIHVWVNQKYLGHILCLAVLIFLGFSAKLGVEHKLLIFASDTGWSYSDMRGFEPFIEPWLLFKVYWAAWAFLFALIAILFWVRSKESGVKARYQLAHHRFPRYRWAIPIATLFIVTFGSIIYYNTNVVNHYSASGETMHHRAEYEKRYGRYEDTPQPLTTATLLYVHLYPENQEATINGTYKLTNKSANDIDTIHIVTIAGVKTDSVVFDRESHLVVADDEFNHRIYVLKESLLPGESVSLSFKVHVDAGGFSNKGVNPSIVKNGTYFRGDAVLPAIGYQPGRRLVSKHDRKKYGLPPRDEYPSLYDNKSRQFRDHAETITFKAIVSTSADQTALAPGKLQRTWTANGRHYFHYATNAPIHNQYAFYSADYALRESKWSPPGTEQSVTIQMYHHATHDHNISRMMESAQASLQYYTENFGPYPYDFFRVIEHPGFGRGMHAEATTIDYMEGYALMNPRDLDLPFHIMAHEVAHQWWAVQLTPAYVEGAGVLTESFATFSAMQVVEKTLGHEHLRRYLRQVRQEYETPRSRYAPPLLRANNSFLNYRKGPFALYAMTQYVGQDTVNSVLRNLLQEYGSGESPLPTTLDLYRKLQAVTPDTLQYLVHDLFATNTYWQLKTEKAQATQIDSSTWHVTLDLHARKVVVDSTAAETEIQMNEWIEIGIFPKAVKTPTPRKPLYLKRHRIRSGRQTITVTVNEEPARAGIDPNHLLIDLEMDDNIQSVKL